MGLLDRRMGKPVRLASAGDPWRVLCMENNEEKMSYGAKLGFWILFGTVLFVGLLLGWKWGVSSVCSSGPNNLPPCLER